MAFWNLGKDLKRRADWLAAQQFVVLAIQVPKDNEKTPQSAEHFFAALHGIYRNDPVVQEYLSFEIVATKESIVFHVFTPVHLKEFVEGQLYAQYPNLQITQIPDYTSKVVLEGKHVATTKIVLTKDEVYPIKTYSASDIDPLAGLTAVMAGLSENEHVWLQMVTRPIGDEWQNKGVAHVKAMRTGQKPFSSAAGVAGRLASRLVREIVNPGTGGDSSISPAEPPKLSAPEEAALKAIETKITKLGFETIFRLVAISGDQSTARARLQAVLAALKQFNTVNLNGFKGLEPKIDDFPSWEQYVNRSYEESGQTLNIEELASLYHFPSKEVETSAIGWAGSKKGEAPFNLPVKEKVDPHDLTVLGQTDFRNDVQEFGIKMDDRKRHMYVIGKSGTGKSTLLENMLIDDIYEGRGVILVDPHGELADKIVESVPENRVQDVVILDPADREFPIAFNLLETVHDDFKGMVASGFVGIFKKIFGHSWGPRLEHILRNTVLALLDSPQSTMLSIPRMLTEQAYRNQVIEQIKDVVIRDFWINEFAAMDQKQRTEAVAPILNKVGQFLSTSTVRNIVGQPRSTIDIRKIMDEKKILIVNLSKGKIGEDNMALLGAMIITKVQLAAMSRADVAADQRPDCFLYVDEFQNFATESFASILSEARKYNLGLVIAHQYIAQMTEEVRDAVIGNVGTLISFRIGAPDASALEKEFEPVFSANDLVNLEKYHIYIKLLVDGMAPPAFSARTLPPRHIEQNSREQVVASSRSLYAKSRQEVEDIIEDAAGYKAKRQAEDAAKAAKAILEQGSSIALKQPVANPTSPSQPQQPVIPQVTKPVNRPVSQPAVSQPVVQVQRPQPVVVAMPEQPTGEGEEKPKKPRVEKPLKIMDKWVYKEVAQKGGMKWYLGEPEEEVRRKLAEKERLKAEAAAAATEETAQKVPAESPSPAQSVPPAPASSIEQKPYKKEAPVEPVKPQEAAVPTRSQQATPQNVKPAEETGQTLREGESLQL